MPEMIPLVIHATHEAGVKLGGIGAVLDGLLGATAYNEAVQRTILVGPMNLADDTEAERLMSPRNGLKIRYSSMHAVVQDLTPTQQRALQQVEQTFEIALLYGTRTFGGHDHEVLLVDASQPNQQQINTFRFHIWQNYGFDASRYQWNPEFNLYLNIAPPLFAALKAIAVDAELAQNEKFIIAHEWLGLPVVFAAQMTEPDQWRTVFYAHEMATARILVEGADGHDTRFYNALAKANADNLDLAAVFGNQDHFFKHPLLHQAIRCDNIFAVGDLVVDELRFLGGAMRTANIDLVYNGIPAATISLAEKLASKERLQQYCENLLGYRPDYVFTHVTRMVLSKALWRDLRVMEHLEHQLQAAGERAVLFVLSTSVPAGRRPEWVAAWEQQYGWPVGHRGDNGDLIDEEVAYFFQGVEPFNHRAQNSQVVLVNQFGWSQDRCGQRMPADMEFMDIRKGSDLEFGQSIYEPFGIAQVEPLSFGALCCVSNICGCVGFAERAADGLENLPNLVVADYVTVPHGEWLDTAHDALRIDRGLRDWIEENNSAAAAETIFERLPKTEAEQRSMLKTGQAVAQKMSWEVVVADYLLPGLCRAID